MNTINRSIKEGIWRQFGASIDMLENAINHCPPDFWDTAQKFWYNSYHCLFWLDYYLTLEPQNFKPPAPYTLSEFDPTGKLPDRTYTKEALVAYLQRSREKCYTLLQNITEDDLLNTRWQNETKDYSLFEILLYNMRHVQHHAAQLNLLLRQAIDDAPKWVAVAKKEME